MGLSTPAQVLATIPCHKFMAQQLVQLITSLLCNHILGDFSAKGLIKKLNGQIKSSPQNPTFCLQQPVLIYSSQVASECGLQVSSFHLSSIIYPISALFQVLSKSKPGDEVDWATSPRGQVPDGKITCRFNPIFNQDIIPKIYCSITEIMSLLLSRDSRYN